MNRVSDQQIVETVANHWILSIRQITSLFFKSTAVARRRLLRTSSLRLTQLFDGPLTGRHGRPERLVALGDRAADHTNLPSEILAALRKPPSLLPHQLLENWFRVMLHQLDQEFTNLTASYTTTSLPSVSSCSRSTRKTSMPERNPGLIPDGHFTLTSRPLKKSLLFFLEVDLSSEPLASSAPNSISRKVQNYRRMLAQKEFGEHPTEAPYPYKGFRVLILTDTLQRSTQAARLIAQMGPSDFVWVTDEESLLSKGLHERIWIRGGRINDRRESIIGSQLHEKASP